MTTLRSIFMIVLSLLLITAAAYAGPKKKPHAATRANGDPKAIGTFGDWIAATYHEAGHLICFAFTRSKSSSPRMAHRGDVVLSVSHRPSDRNIVAMDAGFTYAKGAEVTVRVEKFNLEFHTYEQGAFANNGLAAAAAFRKGSRAVVHSPGPRKEKVADVFSLKGFTAAYNAIEKECPPT